MPYQHFLAVVAVWTTEWIVKSPLPKQEVVFPLAR